MSLRGQYFSVFSSVRPLIVIYNIQWVTSELGLINYNFFFATESRVFFWYRVLLPVMHTKNKEWRSPSFFDQIILSYVNSKSIHLSKILFSQKRILPQKLLNQYGMLDNFLENKIKSIKSNQTFFSDFLIPYLILGNLKL